MDSRFLTIQNIAVRVLERGTGKPVLFMHGHPDSSDMWAPLIDKMPEGFHYIAPEIPGYGQSGDARTFDWSIANRGRFLADVLDALGIAEPVILVCHDHGGPFVCSFAVQYPERVDRLVLQNTLFHRDYDWHLFGKLWRTPLVGEYMAFWQRFAIIRPLLIWYMKRGSPGLSTDYMVQLQKSWTPKMGRAMLALYRASTSSLVSGWDDKLKSLMAQKPTLVLWGECDYYLPVRLAEEWERSGAKLVRFPDAGHWLVVEKPEAYRAELSAFITQ